MNGIGNEWTLLYLILGMSLIAFLAAAEFLRQLMKVIKKISHDVSMLETALDSISTEVSDINVRLQELSLDHESSDEMIG